MSASKTDMSVIMPALNEERDIADAISACLRAFDEYRIAGEVVVVDDGSSDATASIVRDLQKRDSRVSMISHELPGGIGASFWDGVDAARGRSVVMLPGDNENDPREIFKYHRILDHVDIIIPFIFNKQVRSLFRNALSFVYRFIINTTFLVYINYTNGTTLYRKSVLRQLDYHSDGFFFQTDILIRLVKKGYLFAEVPYRLGVRKSGKSKAATFPSFLQVVRGYFRLVKDIYWRTGRFEPEIYTSDSVTKARRDPAASAPDIILDGHKLAWHRERGEARLRGERIAPITIDCALTRACSYRCVYCYGRLQANDEKRMTRDVIMRFLDDAAEIGVKAVSFVSDGESTCSPHVYEAVTHGKAAGLDMALGTNGYLLKDERLGDMLPCLSYLRFNMSAGEPDRYAEIMGADEKAFHKVCATVREAVRIKKERGLPVTIGLQMVLLPDFADQVLPLARLGRGLGADYFVIKHCSDDERGSLKVDYDRYRELTGLLERAEGMSGEGYLVKAKWSKILSRGKRSYSGCLGPPLIIQLSGSGLVAPCGMLFNSRYRKYHVGSIVETRFKDLWRGERYWEVMDLISSERFDARTMCGTLCLQHKVNECLWAVRNGETPWPEARGPEPLHKNFI